MTRCKLDVSPHFRSVVALLIGVTLTGAFLIALNAGFTAVHADPIEPPAGYPKLNTSVKAVTPTLAATGGATLTYEIELRNTGAYTAFGATLTDPIPAGTTYNGDASSSVSATLTVTEGVLSWTGDVGFDDSVVVSFSVAVSPTFTGTVKNTAVISHPLMAESVDKSAATIVTDEPILTIEKTSAPEKPGPNKELIYTLVVANQGQPMSTSMPITVTDRVPLSTTVADVGPDGVSDTAMVTWTRDVTLDLGETTAFTFSVMVDDVTPGTVITNADYQVDGPEAMAGTGAPYTVTVVNPDLRLSKQTWPDPPGSNREMTYILELFNAGSLATDLVITDSVPDNVTYERGGAETDGVVSWTLDSLDTGQSAEFTYTVYISDVMGMAIVNDNYAVCAQGESICQPGKVLTSVVQGPTFAVFSNVDPIAKKPGGGQNKTTVTATLVARNLGPGNALDAQALLEYRHISVSNADEIDIASSTGEPKPDPIAAGIPDCSGGTCVAYAWMGNVAYGETITFTTGDQSTIETVGYSATIMITDDLSGRATAPITATSFGTVTQQANLRVSKSAPKVIGRGQVMTYTIDVWNSALATDEPPFPYVRDFLPDNVELITSSISHGGMYQTVSGTLGLMKVISWTLPGFGTGDQLDEPLTFAVRVNDDLVSGTEIVNQWYNVNWWEGEAGRFLQNQGEPITTTVKEVGLIDSYKEVTPALALPGANTVLTYYLHLVNSSPITATDVTVEDHLPWQSSTYRRDAVASAGEIVSDIVSLRWSGDVPPLSSEVVTLSVLMDEGYQGPLTNTAVISSPDLLSPVEVQAVAYVTEKPVLEISKQASRDDVEKGETIEYTIQVVNRGQDATALVITDTLPENTAYVPDSATGGGELKGGDVLWEVSTLALNESRELKFVVTVTQQSGEVVNDQYSVVCDEGVAAIGDPVVTKIVGGSNIYLPLVLRNSP